MENKKYELTNISINVGDKTLYRIKSLREFVLNTNVRIHEGDIGGYVESEENLSHSGSCWITDEAKVFDKAYVSEDALIFDNAKIYNNAKISGNSRIYDYADVSEFVKVFDNARICDSCIIKGQSKIYGNAIICGDANISGNAEVYEDAIVKENAKLSGFVTIHGNARIGHHSCISSDRYNITKTNKFEEYKRLQKYKELFITGQLKQHPEADRRVIQFIADFLYHEKCDIDNIELIRLQFRSGYCYHFAIMLRYLFKEGSICWAAPFGHIVWVYNDVPYDIEGVCESEYEYLIPIEYLGDAIKDFEHIRYRIFDASQEDIQNIINEYKRNNNIK